MQSQTAVPVWLSNIQLLELGCIDTFSQDAFEFYWYLS